MAQLRKNSDIKDIVLFLLLSFGLPFICVLLVKNIRAFQSGWLNLILYGIEAMTPTLSALIVVWTLSGRQETILFIKKCYRVNIKLFNILLAIAVPSLILTMTKLSSIMIGFGNGDIGATFTSKRLLIVLWALIAEELGWRGFLQNKIDRRYGFPATPIMIGMIWALWHYHFFLLGTTTAPIILFLIGCIAESFGYYWITKRAEGNILPASIWHFIGNLLINLFLLSPEYNKNSNIPYMIFVFYTTIMAIIIYFRLQHSKRDE